MAVVSPTGRAWRRRSALVVGLVVLLGALGTGLATSALHLSARHSSTRTFEQKQDVIAKVVVAELIQYGVALADLSASIAAQPQLTAATFAAITAPMNSSRLPGATEVGFVISATPAAIPAVQAQWRQRGSSALTLQPAATGAHYFPVLGRALDSGFPTPTPGPSVGGSGVPLVSAPVLGHDLAGTAPVVEALRDARTPGKVATSPTFLPPGGDRVFIMAAAVYATAPAGQAGQFHGWVTMTFRGRDFLGPAVGLIGGDQVRVEFADISGGTPVTIARWRPAARVDPGLPSRTIDLPLPEPGTWRLVVKPTVRLLPAAEAWLAHAAAGVGTVLTLLLAALTATVVTSRDRALRRVDQATTDLRHDIARREAVEQQLRRREEELMRFAGVVAHDLRSPLTNVIGYADLMAEADLPTGLRGHLDRVQHSADRMHHLIDDLLAYAAADHTTLRLTEIDLDDLVGQVITDRLGLAGADPATRIDRAPLPRVLGDPTQIHQVLDNLIGNALKYTPPGHPAEITISAAAPSDPSVSAGLPKADPELAAGQGGALCRIEVADRGIGIPAEQLGEVFNAFTRAAGSERYPGTGLGLAIVQRIVERHVGTAGVAANPGGGSCFWFTLPAAPPAEVPAEALVEARELTTSPLTPTGSNPKRDSTVR